MLLQRIWEMKAMEITVRGPCFLHHWQFSHMAQDISDLMHNGSSAGALHKGEGQGASVGLKEDLNTWLPLWGPIDSLEGTFGERRAMPGSISDHPGPGESKQWPPCKNKTTFVGNELGYSLRKAVWESHMGSQYHTRRTHT